MLGLGLRVWTEEVSRDDRSGRDMRVRRLLDMIRTSAPLPLDRWEPIGRHPHPYSRGVVVESERVTRLRHRERVGGVRWRSELAVSDEWINELRSDSREDVGWGATRPVAWRSLNWRPLLGGVRWRSDLAERLGGVSRMDQQTAIGQPGGSGPGWDAADSLALSDWRSLIGAL
jgi:hypothetical protein